MRDYGKVHTSFWTSEDIKRLSDDGRMLAIYLLSGPHTTQLGCFRLPDGYAAEDLGWGSERVSKGFAELSRNGFADRDEGSKWVLIHKFLRWNQIENPNQGKAAAKLFDQIPDACPVKPLLARALREYAPKFPAEILDQYETVSERLPKPFRNQEQEQEQEQDIRAEQKPLALAASEPPKIPTAELPLNDGTMHPVYDDDIAKWRAAYPAVDVLGELRRMAAWLDANRARRKTARGINAFVVTWLTRCQDRPQRANGTTGEVDQFGIPL